MILVISLRLYLFSLCLVKTFTFTQSLDPAILTLKGYFGHGFFEVFAFSLALTGFHLSGRL